MRRRMALSSASPLVARHAYRLPRLLGLPPHFAADEGRNSASRSTAHFPQGDAQTQHISPFVAPRIGALIAALGRATSNMPAYKAQRYMHDFAPR